jgi:hypothetical protein
MVFSSATIVSGRCNSVYVLLIVVMRCHRRLLANDLDIVTIVPSNTFSYAYSVF